MSNRTPMEITQEYNEKKVEEAERKEREKEEEWRRENSYGGGCPHTVTDESLGMIFCVRCGVVTEEQIFHQGGGWYGSWRSAKREERKPKEKKPRKKAAK